jgi:uncharacterized membrane protein YeaQ/YmgE (transglycosylase-associated protein family)
VTDLIVFILIGLAVGVIARLIMPGRDAIGILGTIVLGIVGALVGGWLFGAVFKETEGVDWIGSIVVAMGLLWVYRRMSVGRGTAL